MEDSKRRAFIKQQAAKKKLEGSLPPKTGQANPSTKRKLSKKVDCPPKKPKVVTGSIVGKTPASSKLPPKPGLGKGKGLMKGLDPVTKKSLFLLREDLGYALKDDEYEDLGNHATGAMGETGLFSLARVCSSVPFLYSVILLSRSNLRFLFLQGLVMMKGLTDRYASHETMMSHLKQKMEARETELRELKAWNEVQVNKLDLTRQLLEESEEQVEALKKILKDKEGEISEAKG